MSCCRYSSFESLKIPGKRNAPSETNYVRNTILPIAKMIFKTLIFKRQGDASNLFFLAGYCLVRHENDGRENLHNFELSCVFLLIALLKLLELVYPGALSVKFEPQQRNFFS